MAWLKSSNPVMQEKTFQGTVLEGMSVGEEMTLKGTMNKFGVLIALTIASTMFAWTQIYKGSDPRTLIITGGIAALVVAVILIFKMKWAPFLAPAYAIFKGLVVGAISALYNIQYNGLPVQAIALTLLVTLVMFLIYRYRIIKVTNKFRTVIVVATGAIALFYLIQFLTYSIGGTAIASSFTNSATPLSIGFSILVTALAAFNLLLNFDTIEKGIEVKAPKYMEWYGAFGLLVTIIWLYLEILRLLSKLQRN